MNTISYDNLYTIVYSLKFEDLQMVRRVNRCLYFISRKKYKVKNAVRIIERFWRRFGGWVRTSKKLLSENGLDCTKSYTLTSSHTKLTLMLYNNKYLEKRR